MYEVLQGFFDKHEDLRGAEFYVTGESYAGHYVPAVASYISKQNKELQGGDSRHIDLKAIAIGNGLTDPLVQYSAYGDYVLERGLISKAFRDTIDLAYYAVCAPALLACKDKGVGCVIGLETCQLAVVAPLVAAIEAKLGHVMNPYNVTGACEHPPLCYDFSAITAYMQLESTREALHVTGDHEWETCDAGVHVALTADWMRDLELVVPGLLADGVRVLVYAGEDDFICNYKGNEKWVHAMKWPGQAAYDAASKDPKPWVVNGAPAGTAIESGNLTFLRVFKAGHMVPMDQPEAALDMINRLVSGRRYADGVVVDFIGHSEGEHGAAAI
uniref:Carboxypeptidase n=2 Tax=Prasinoderma coloniale TaxID=156133 RepID=A0A7R9TQ83_9VIRI|mmetsp:Transcript_456/g.1726  ORF Transcript_456/g.1726 Transcript_456/m.1726 type:complete len:329 (+) Transcript_456:206-1192(+)